MHLVVVIKRMRDLGLTNFVQDDGLAYRLVPLRPNPAEPTVNADTMYETLMQKFKFGGADKNNIYFDENGRRVLISIRSAFSTLGQVLAGKGDKDSALKVLNYGYQKLNPTTLPYGMVSFRNQEDITSMQYAYAFYLAGDSVKGAQIADAVIRDCREQVDYYNSLSDNDAGAFQEDLQTAKAIVGQLENLKQQFTKKTTNPLEGGTPVGGGKDSSSK